MISLADPRSQLETRCFTQFTTAGQVAYTTSECWKTHFKNKSANKQSTILGLAVRQLARQKAVVDMLHDLHGLDFTISNKKCFDWETAPGNAVLDNASAHGGCFVPPGTQKSFLACFIKVILKLPALKFVISMKLSIDPYQNHKINTKFSRELICRH